MIDKLLKDAELVDTYRFLNPEKVEYSLSFNTSSGPQFQLYTHIPSFCLSIGFNQQPQSIFNTSAMNLLLLQNQNFRFRLIQILIYLIYIY